MQGGTARAPLALALAVDIEHGRGHRARLAGLLRDGTQNLGDGHHGVLIGLLFFHMTGKPKAPKTEKKGAAVFVFYRRSASVQATRLRHALGRAIQRVVIACPCAFAAPELRDRWVGAVSENTQSKRDGRGNPHHEHEARASDSKRRLYPHRPDPPREVVRSLK